MASTHSSVNNSRKRDLQNLHFYARKVISMWRYWITRLLSRKYPEQVIPDKLTCQQYWLYYLIVLQGAAGLSNDRLMEKVV